MEIADPGSQAAMCCRDSNGVPVSEAAILDFVGKSFSSVWSMELLLLLYNEPRRAWQPDTLVRELRANIQVVNEGLRALEAIGFIAIDNDHAYRFQPSSAEVGKVASELADLYSRKPRAVMRAIFSAPKDTIQTFADAFRLRKDTC
jgi:hypothetical protein